MRKFLSGIWTITATALALALTTTGVALAEGGFVDADELGATFDGDTQEIDNPWWPLPQGLKQVSAAVTEDGCSIGVVNVVPWNEYIMRTEVYSPRVAHFVDVQEVMDREFLTEDDCEDVDWSTIADPDFPDALDLDLGEITLDWYAQDDQGRVWYFGEFSISVDPEDIDECDHTLDTLLGEFGCPDGSWEAGINIFTGADDYQIFEGIIMLNENELVNGKGKFYFQEFWEDEATDMAKILNFKDVDTFLDVPNEKCLMTKEWVPLEPGNVEHKYYCYDTGLVLVEGNAGGKTEWTDLIFDSVVDAE